jgi:hypothetical protein
MQQKLNVADVTEIAKVAARKHDLPVEIVGAVFSGGSDYVEIFVHVDGCAVDPCRFAIGVFRDAPHADLVDDIADGLRRHLQKHRHDPLLSPIRTS